LFDKSFRRGKSAAALEKFYDRTPLVSDWARAMQLMSIGPIMGRLRPPELVRRSRYRLLIAITPGIERDGAVDVRNDPGHAVVVVKDTFTNEFFVLSYGPRDPTQLFMMEKTLGDPSHAISSADNYTAFRWTISEEGFGNASAYIKARTMSPEVYDAKHQCTTEAIEVAKRAGISLPPAPGKLLYEMPAQTTPPRIVDSSTPASLMRVLKRRATEDPGIDIEPLSVDYFRHHRLKVVEK
jgi:hypothetical protein